MLIDQYLPDYDYNAIYKVKVAASPDRVYEAIKELKPADISPLVFWMLNLREFPAKLLGKGSSESFGDEPFLNQLYAGGFIHLGEENDRELVFGLIGQFWKLTGGEGPPYPIPDGHAFIEFTDLDYAKVAANLAVSQNETDGSIFCSTETRIHVPDPKTRRKFSLYWRLISMGSGWIRVLWLRAIKRKAENMQ